jgi:hypothetical protein
MVERCAAIAVALPIAVLPADSGAKLFAHF